MLAHQGGWDEILMVVGPMVVIGGVLAVARRRIGRPGPPAGESAETGNSTVTVDAPAPDQP